MAVSLRRSLAVRYSITMAVALLGVALWAYAGLRRTLLEQLEHSLRTTYELQERSLLEHGRITASPAPADPGGFVALINRLVVVRDSAGRLVQSNTTLASELPIDSAGLRRALAGEWALRTGVWHGSSIRVLAGPAAPGSRRGTAVLEVAASLEPLEAASRRILHRLLATALLGGLATLVGAWWLARSALAPVEEIAAQAAAIQGGTPGRRITIHRDVEELQGLVRVLNAMLERLERSYEWHRRMIVDLGHDLRTPITTMRAGIELALATPRTPDQYRAVLASTMEEVDRLVLIGEALSLLGHLESGSLQVLPELTDLRTVAGQAVSRFRERVGGHLVNYDRPGQPILAEVDARLLGLALDQLLDNAMRHTPPQTRVDVTLVQEEGRAVLAVEDEGPGVPDDLLPHLFERFYRADAARGRNGGPGLGLTVVATIAELHHGRAAAEPGRAGGLRVRLELPAPAPEPALAPM